MDHNRKPVNSPIISRGSWGLGRRENHIGSAGPATERCSCNSTRAPTSPGGAVVISQGRQPLVLVRRKTFSPVRAREPPWLGTESKNGEVKKGGDAQHRSLPVRVRARTEPFARTLTPMDKGTQLGRFSREVRRMSRHEGARQRDFGRRHMGLRGVPVTALR